MKTLCHYISKYMGLLVLAAAAVYLTVFVLAKQKKIFINKWFVDETHSIIGVDVSSYQADIDMNRLKEQNIKFPGPSYTGRGVF